MSPIIHRAVEAVAEATGAVGLSEQVSKEQAETRWLICQQCQFLNPDHTCQKCGCAMESKVQWETIAGFTVTCPHGFWE